MGRKGRVAWEAVRLSTDHRPSLKSERATIEAAGGVVEAYKDKYGQDQGPLRIWIPNSAPPAPGLDITRSLGDSQA